MMVCPFCNDSKIMTIDAGSEFGGNRHWWFCSSCELYFLSDIPTQEELQEYYAGAYFSAQQASNIAYYLRAWFSTMRAVSQRMYIETHHRSEKKRVLEVGSSDGSLLAVLKRKGWDVLGLELSEFGRRKAHERHGIILLPLDITEMSPAKYQFDCIVFSHVLEHMPDPQGILEHSRNLLSQNGRIFIELPHSPLPAEVSSDILTLFLNTTHLYNFRLKSLPLLVEQSGLTVTDQTRYFYHVSQYQWNRAPLFGSILMRSVLESGNPTDIANLMFFLVQMNIRHLAGKDTMMPVDRSTPWIGFGDNIRLMAGR